MEKPDANLAYSLSVTTSGATRSIKKRTGCEQCKRRKVKCDEKKPICSRCEKRRETCTGNFEIDKTWRIERPWFAASQGSVPGPASENETLRYWYEEACLIMAMFPPPTNPLSFPIAKLLQRSKALRHTIQCVSDGHRRGFSSSGLADALLERNLAIVSLRGEISRIQSTTCPPVLIRVMILSSLILCLSASWLDSSRQDFGMEFLLGCTGLMRMLADCNPTDEFAFYVLGLYTYSECFSSYLVPVSMQRKPDQRIISLAQRPPFSTLIHPVTGIATTLCPIITEIGQYYRAVVECKEWSMGRDQDLRKRLLEWKSPEGCPVVSQLERLSEGYRSMGDIMLYQARSVCEPLDSIDSWMLSEKVHNVIETITNIPQKDTLLNWVGPLLVIAGSELQSSCQDQRLVIEQTHQHLLSFTRIPTYKNAMEITRHVWHIRDGGGRVTWLECMVQQGIVLALG